MTTIYTFPDFNFNRHIKKILITNADWEESLLQEIVNSLDDDKELEIYVEGTKIKDMQWFEGIRTAASQVIDWRRHKDTDPIIFIKELTNAN